MKKVLLLVAIMTGSVLNAQILPSGVPTTNLKAYYSFNSSLNDLSGNNHTASYLGNSSRVDGYRTCLDSATNSSLTMTMVVAHILFKRYSFNKAF